MKLKRIATASMPIVIYAMGAFISLEPNIFDWSVENRAVFLAFSILAALACANHYGWGK